MQSILKGNVVLCAHQEQVSYELVKGKKNIVTTHLSAGFLVLTGPAGGISGGLCEN